jgi:hypothetical protein
MLSVENYLLPVSKSPLFEDLTNAFLSVNIPLHKLNQPTFRQILEKFTRRILCKKKLRL